MKQFYKILLLLLITFGSRSMQAQFACSNVFFNITDRDSVCNGTCAWLTAALPELRKTTSYTVDAIPYVASLPCESGGISAPGSIRSDDIHSTVVPIGFDFCFFGNTYNQAVMSANGYVTFNTALAGTFSPWAFTSAAALPSSVVTQIRNSILGPFQDIDPSVSYSPTYVTYQTVGVAPWRAFIVKYTNIPMFSCTGSRHTSTIVCYETTNYIEIYMTNKPVCPGWNGGLAIEGIQNSTGTVGYAVPGRNATVWTATNDAYRFTPNGPQLPVQIYWYELGGSGIPLAADTTVSLCPSLPGPFPAVQNYYARAVILDSCTFSASRVDSISLYDSATVYVKGALITPVFHEDSIRCGQDSIRLDAGLGGVKYTWGLYTTNRYKYIYSAGDYLCLKFTDTNLCYLDSVAFHVVPISTMEDTFLYQRPPLCHGDNNGYVVMRTTNAAGRVRYGLDGATPTFGDSILNIPAGAHYVIVLDSFNCRDSMPFTFVEPPSLILTLDSLYNLKCNGDSSGRIKIIGSGGVTPYSYYWSDASALWTDSTSGSILNQIPGGNYTIEIVDSHNCRVSQMFVVTEPTRLLIDSFTTDSVQCFEGGDGMAHVFVSGGTAGYTYLWSSGSTTDTANSLSAGFYSVTVKDVNLCSIEDSVRVIQPSEVFLIPDSIRQITCNNAGDGLIILNAVGGTPPYTYSDDAITFGSIRIFSGYSAGTRVFYVRDAHNCQDTMQFTYINPLAIEPYMISMRPESCPGKADGNVVIATTYGVPGFQYSTDNVTYGFSTTLGGLTTNSYTAYVRDTNGCIDSVNVSVGLRAPLVLDLDSVNVRCNNGNDGIVIANLVGGEAPYQYQLGVAPFTSSNTFNTLAAGFYTVNIRDTNNCITSASIVVNQPVRIQPTILSTTTVTCFGQTDGSVTLGHVNGSAPFSYSVDAGPFGSSNVVSGLSAGSHIAYVKDSTNCIDSISFSTGNPSDIVTVLTARTNVSCFGGNDGRLQVSSTGGASTTYTYAWSNGDIGNFADSLTVGTYYVTTTDSNACFVIDTFIITQPSLLVNSLTSTSLLCYGNTNATIISTTSGGTPAYSYLWNDPSAQTTPTAIGLSAGTYTVTVTDILGCTDVDSMTILQPDSLSLSYVSTNITCYGGFNGTITASGGGGTGVISYSIGGAYQLSGSFTGLTPGLYILTVKDANNCTKSLNLTLTQPLRIIPTILSLRNELCNGDRNAAVQIGHTNGFAPFQYSLDKTLYQLSDSFTSLAVGNYRAYVVDSLFCIDSINFTITEPAPITISTVPTMNKCFGDSTGGMTFTARGGSTPYSYSIDNGTTYQSSNAFTSLVAGTYFIKVRDNNGCMGSASFTLVNPPKYIIDATAFEVLCWDSENGSIQIANTGGTPPYANYQYSRDNISFLTSAVSNIINLAGGFYYIEAFDGNGCLASDTATIGKPPIDVFSITVDSTTCYGPQYLDGAIHVDATANPPYTYSVDGGPQELNANLYGLGAGPHLVIASNRNGCIDSMMVTIPSPPPIIVDVIPDTVFLALGASIPVLVVQQNAVNETYLWSSGLGLSCIDCKDPIVSAYNDIVYQVKVYDHRYQFSTEDCYAEATLYVFVEDHVRSYLPNAFVPGKGGENATFKIYGEGIKLIRWSVYDRWGEKLFESNRQDIGWDGTYKGSLVNPGVYVYFVEAEYLDGQRETYSGSVTVLR